MSKDTFRIGKTSRRLARIFGPRVTPVLVAAAAKLAGPACQVAHVWRIIGFSAQSFSATQLSGVFRPQDSKSSLAVSIAGGWH
jgi:hypothetical protein